jgi:hypothetical protein
MKPQSFFQRTFGEVNSEDFSLGVMTGAAGMCLLLALLAAVS